MLVPTSRRMYAFTENTKDSLLDLPMDILNFMKKTADYVVQYPDQALAMLGMVVSLLHASRSLVVSHRVYSENRRADRRVYDSKHHTHWTLRRPLSNAEKNILFTRTNSGEEVYDILNEWHLV